MIHNLSTTNSIVNRYIAQLRDVKDQLNRSQFRHNLERLGHVFGYEISKYLDFEEAEVETPLGVAHTTLPYGKVVLCSILRAGLPLHNGILDVLDYADNAFIAAYRKNHKDGTFEIRMDYITCPDLNDAVLILIDPMLATGASIESAISTLSEYGTYRSLHIVSAIASIQGAELVSRLYPQANLWIGALDEELTAKSYIVPGLGDAGDLAYGSKLQE